MCELAAQMPAVAVSDGEGTREWLLRLEGGDSPPGAEPDEFPTHAMWRFVDWVVDCAARTALSQSRTAAASPQIDFDPRPYFLTTNVRLVERWAAALHTWEGEFYLTSSAVKRVREAFDSWRRPEGALPGRLARLSLFLVPEQEGEAASPDESPTGGEGGATRPAAQRKVKAKAPSTAQKRATASHSSRIGGDSSTDCSSRTGTLKAKAWACGRSSPMKSGPRRAMRRRPCWGGLARASAVFEPLARSLREDRPTGCTLTASELETLLQVAAPQLERLDVVLRLPAWAARAPVPVRASVRVLPAEGPERLSLGSLLSYDWRIAIGETEVSPELFRRLVDQSLAALRLNGEWIRLDGGQIRRLLGMDERRAQPAHYDFGI